MQARYQYGNLTVRKRKKGPNVWQFRWIENGRPKSVLIGTVEKLPTQADAERAVEHQRIKINAQNPQQRFHAVTVEALVERYKSEEMPTRYATRVSYLSYLKRHIVPRWGTWSSAVSAQSMWKRGSNRCPSLRRRRRTFEASCTCYFNARVDGSLQIQTRLILSGRAQDAWKFLACLHRKSFPPCLRISRNHTAQWCLSRDASDFAQAKLSGFSGKTSIGIRLP